MSLALELKQVKKTYHNGVVALKGIDLSVNRGEFIALLGPNGAGKSTTIGIINSLVLKTGGEVFVCGHHLVNDASAAKSCVGVVPQEFNIGIFEKVLQVVINQAGYYGIPRAVAQERAKKYLTLLELWGKRHHIVRNLSGGMKRRLMIARALVHEPKLLILDEPTAGVDVEIRRTLWRLLRQLNADGKTIILTTHYLEEAETLCDRIAIIHHGEIVHDLPKKQLLQLLNAETFVLDLQFPLSVLPKTTDFLLHQIDPLTIEVTMDKSKSVNALFDFLNQQQIQVTSIRNGVNRLEALFLRITGPSNAT